MKMFIGLVGVAVLIYVIATLLMPAVADMVTR